MCMNSANNNKGLVVSVFWNDKFEGEAELKNLICKAEEREFWEVKFLDKDTISCRWVNKKDIKVKANN